MEQPGRVDKNISIASIPQLVLVARGLLGWGLASYFFWLPHWCLFSSDTWLDQDDDYTTK